MRTPTLRTALLPLIACLSLPLSGCGNGPPPEVPQAKEPPKAKPRLASDLPARAVRSAREPAQFLGTVGTKNVYSVDGERWAVDESGKTEREAGPLGDWLESVSAFTQAGLAAIGWNSQHAYTFADVLGAPKAAFDTNSPFTHVRPGPNAVLLFTLFSATAVDLSTGLEKGGFFPAFPVRDALFLDARRGVVATAIGGVGTTTDGGKTWKPVTYAARVYPTLDLGSDGRDVFLEEIYSNRVTRVDIDKAEVGDWTPAPAPPERAKTPIEAWITAFGNPLRSAVTNGIDAGKGTGIVAWGDTVARVDLATGLFTETATFAGTGGECRGAMAGKEAYLVCGGKKKGKRGAGEQLWRVKTAGKLEMEEIPGATFGGPGAADVLGSGAGGLLVLQGCGDKWGSHCVRQPDGKFSQVEPDLVPYRDIVPLADGRIVSVGVRIGATGPLLELVTSTERERKVLEEVSFDEGVKVDVSRPEQGEDGVIRFLVKEQKDEKPDAFLYLYAYEPGKAGDGAEGAPARPGAPWSKRGFRKTALPDGAQVSLRDGVLLSAAKDSSKLAVSHDFGATWKDLDMPKGAPTAFRAITRLGLVSPVLTRVGWGPLPAEPAPSKPAPSLQIKAQAPVTKETTEISCKVDSAVQRGEVLPRPNSDPLVAFGVDSAPPAGTRRTEVRYMGAPLDPVMLLRVEAKEPRSGASKAESVPAERWAVHWIDPGEPSAKRRSLSVKAPYPGMAFVVRGVWAQESKVFFTVGVDGKFVVARSKDGGLETAEVHVSLYPGPGTPVAFSADGKVIAYLAGELLVVWQSGEAPRPIAAVNQRSGAMLGAPTKEGVPVFVDMEGQSYYRVFPLPANKPSAQPHEERVSASWDGWTRSVTLFGGRGQVRLCDARPAGSTFHSTSYGPQFWTRLYFDDIGGEDRVGTSTSTVRYDVVTDGQTLCLKNLTAFIGGGVKVDAKIAGKDDFVEGLELIRLSGKKGQLTRVGKSAKPPLLTMTCGPASQKGPDPEIERKTVDR